MRDQAQRQPAPEDGLPPRISRPGDRPVTGARRSARPSRRTAAKPPSKAPSARAAAPKPRSQAARRKDPLAYKPLRIVDGGIPMGRPPRPSAHPGSRRRNRLVIPPVVLWNRRFRSVRNLLFAVLVVEMAWLALNSPLLAVDRVTVTGAHIRTPQQVVQIAGLTRRTNIFRAPAHRAEATLARLPEVAEVRVQRRLPRTLALTIRERTPVASVLTREGYWEMDAHGLVFRRLRQPLPNRPLLVVQDVAKVALGRPLPLKVLAPVLKCLAQLPGLPLARNTRLHVDASQEAWLNSPDGFKVRLGPVDNAPERLALTSRILNGPDGREVMAKSLVLDVTTPDSEVRIPRDPGDAGRLSGQP